MIRTIILTVGMLTLAACGDREDLGRFSGHWTSDDGAFEVNLPPGWKIIDSKSEAEVRGDSPSYEVAVMTERDQAGAPPSCNFWFRDIRALTPETLSLELDVSLEEAAAFVQDARRDGKRTYLSPDHFRSYAEAAVEVVCTELDGCATATVESFRLGLPQDASIEASWTFRYQLGNGEQLRQFVIADRNVAEDHIGLRMCLFSSYADRARYGIGDLAALRAAMDF
ncbi:MAG: hypothetical protein IPK75_19230 [Acidobacteria bacterium]|nr:hypothetical protein [Acidobacteriota bacterium]